jgi:hypothetical protein
VACVTHAIRVARSGAQCQHDWTRKNGEGAKKRRGWKRVKALSFGGNGKGGKALCFNGDDFRLGASGVVREAGRLMAQHGGERRWASVVA